jgi:hypothetical protein
MFRRCSEAGRPRWSADRHDAPMLRAPVAKSCLAAGLPRLFNPCYIPVDAAVAQLVEQRIRNAWVGGSNPFRGTGAFYITG